MHELLLAVAVLGRLLTCALHLLVFQPQEMKAEMREEGEDANVFGMLGDNKPKISLCVGREWPCR